MYHRDAYLKVSMGKRDIVMLTEEGPPRRRTYQTHVSRHYKVSMGQQKRHDVHLKVSMGKKRNRDFYQRVHPAKQRNAYLNHKP